MAASLRRTEIFYQPVAMDESYYAKTEFWVFPAFVAYTVEIVTEQAVASFALRNCGRGFESECLREIYDRNDVTNYQKSAGLAKYRSAMQMLDAEVLAGPMSFNHYDEHDQEKTWSRDGYG